MAKLAPDDLEAVRTVVAALQAFDSNEQERILRWSREKLGLTVSVASGAGERERKTVSTGSESSAPTASASIRVPDIKSFVESKSPRSDIQFAATVAYYYRFEAPEPQRKASITSADLQEACRQTGRQRLKRPITTLSNAHTQGYLDRGSDRGSFVLNTVGENLVAMTLPEGDTRGAAPRSRKAARRRSADRSRKKSNKARQGKKKLR